MIVTIPGTPVAKPRGQRSDKWKKRDCMVKYWGYKDRLKAHVPESAIADIAKEGALGLVFFLPFPKSYSKKKRAQLSGAPHRMKPDVDNMIKSALDSLWPQDDSFIWHFTEATKRWEDERGPRTEIFYLPGRNEHDEQGP